MIIRNADGLADVGPGFGYGGKRGFDFIDGRVIPLVQGSGNLVEVPTDFPEVGEQPGQFLAVNRGALLSAGTRGSEGRGAKISAGTEACGLGQGMNGGEFSGGAANGDDPHALPSLASILRLGRHTPPLQLHAAATPPRVVRVRKP
jgi:hypothetical protein